MMAAAWEAKGWTQAEFCRRIGKPAGWVQQIRQGKKTPPLDLVEIWGGALGLSGQQLALFVDLAAAMHVPEEARHRFIRMAREQGKAGVR